MTRLHLPRPITVGLMTGAVALALVACSSDSDSSSSASNTTTTAPMTSAAPSSSAMPTDTIVDVASGSSDFSTLVQAVTAAGLDDTLSGQGPFTVFAPTNEAFAKLPASTLESLLKPENKQKLTDILTYHVIPSKVMAADVTSGTVKTVNGEELTFAVNGSNVTITDGQGNTVNVVKTDIPTSNGVIHAIDGVLLPTS